MIFKEAKQLLIDKDIVEHFESGQRRMYYVYWSDGGYGKMNKDSIISHAQLYE
jgi:hypothetical protein